MGSPPEDAPNDVASAARSCLVILALLAALTVVVCVALGLRALLGW